MTLVVLDTGSDVAPYEQVRLQLAAHVSAGRIEAGAKLPTVRALAAELDLAVNTVARAYRELEADGVIATEGRRGTFVRGAAAADDVRAAAGSFTATARQAGLSLPEATRLVEKAWGDAGRP
jgi:DNA-binding transcriptional regulator YhcF (GntR family)